MNSFAESLMTAINDGTTYKYPYVRRDKAVRALIVNTFKDDNVESDHGSDHNMVLMETVQVDRKGSIDYRFDPLKRIVTKEYFDNNYWEGND